MLLIAIGALPTIAVAQTVPLMIRITEVTALEDFPGFDATSGADFFMRATVNGVTQTSPIFDDDDTLEPQDLTAWVFTFQIPTTQREVLVTLDLRDHDPDPESDALADISPSRSERNLVFSVDMATRCYAGGGLTPGDTRSGVAFCTEGHDDDSNEARVCLKAQVQDGPDSDNDGLPDGWETLGYDADHDCGIGAFENLPGANPTRKDIFVQVDYMDCAVAGGDCPIFDGHSHRFKDEAKQAAVDAFAAHDITLHVFVHEALPHRRFMVLPGGCIEKPCGNAESFNTIKAAHFAPPESEVRLMYHYAVFGHLQDVETGVAGCGETHGNDFIVTLGAFEESPWEQTGVFMHELGHNLGLRHGGDDDVNFKPNYPSVMNYWLTMTRIIDYSSGTLPPPQREAAG
jgi:hypothetical protein